MPTTVPARATNGCTRRKPASICASAAAVRLLPPPPLDYNHISGQKNTLDSDLLNYTAPPYVQKGNTLFDISNSSSASNPVNLFALAADYRELDFIVSGHVPTSPRYEFNFFADFVRNVGYDAAAVDERVGYYVKPRINGYESQVGFGSPALDRRGAWDAFVGYRYLQRDAVLDAFTDQDYHLGGTDAKGFIIGADASITSRVWARLRYMPFEAIDGPPLAIDVWQLDLNARF